MGNPLFFIVTDFSFWEPFLVPWYFVTHFSCHGVFGTHFSFRYGILKGRTIWVHYLVYDTVHYLVYDTVHYRVYDTVHYMVYDTVHYMVYDTVHYLVYDTVHYMVHYMVYDTVHYRVHYLQLKFSLLSNLKTKIYSDLL